MPTDNIARGLASNVRPKQIKSSNNPNNGDVLVCSDNQFGWVDNTRSQYLWIEEKTINKGGNSFTLTNPHVNGQELWVRDTKYGQEWIKGLHYNVNGQVVTLTESALDETLTFKIVNFG